jgi:hypothetical protein
LSRDAEPAGFGDARGLPANFDSPGKKQCKLGGVNPIQGFDSQGEVAILTPRKEKGKNMKKTFSAFFLMASVAAGASEPQALGTLKNG